MINKNLMGRNQEDPYGQDLSEAPEYDFPPDPQDNSLAMLGDPSGDTGELPPGDAGPAQDLAYLGMVVQGLQALAAKRPGFVPMEIMAWLEMAMQQLPELIRQDLSGMGAGAPGMGMGAGMSPMAALGPAAQPQQPGPSGPPQPPR
jgi:hypothetical protein